LEGKPDAPKTRRGRPKALPRTAVHLYANLNDEEIEALRRICDYWGATKSEVIRTMIRYFDVNLGLNKKAPRQ
jgi:hypothetical protein